jgi:hypothetical protein
LPSTRPVERKINRHLTRFSPKGDKIVVLGHRRRRSRRQRLEAAGARRIVIGFAYDLKNIIDLLRYLPWICFARHLVSGRRCC